MQFHSVHVCGQKLVQRWESELEDAVRAGLRSLQYTSDKENLDRLCATSQLEIEEALRNLSTGKSA